MTGLRQIRQMGRPGSVRTTHAVAVVVLVLAAAVLIVFKVGPGSTPPGQPPLVRLADITRFDADFNAACYQVRALVLLSPT